MPLGNNTTAIYASEPFCKSSYIPCFVKASFTFLVNAILSLPSKLVTAVIVLGWPSNPLSSLYIK